MASAIFRTGDRPLLNLGLFGLTAVTTFFGYLTTFLGWWFGAITPELFAEGAKFSAGVLLILGTHEMGHYVAARRHGVDTTLPFFIPTPPGLTIGTLGAVIRIRDRIPTLNALMDIGAAGPLAGLVVAVPVLLLGIADAQVSDALPVSTSFPRPFSLWALGGGLWDYLMTRASGEAFVWPQVVGTLYHDNLFMKALVALVHGPLGDDKDLLGGPLVFAGWFGLLVTLLNLFPIGQLDGGHVTYALFGRFAPWIGRAVAAVLAFLTVFFSIGWLVWLLVTVKFIGFHHPEVVEPNVPLSPGRKLIGVLCLIAFVLCFLPVPISPAFVR